jgi:hypothetical protein
MENKMLSIQNFYSNQDVLSAINQLLIHLDLHGTGIDDKIASIEIENAKKMVKEYLKKLNKNLEEYNKDKNKPMIGIDAKQRGFIKSFVEAKKSSGRYKSILFRKNINALEAMMQEDYYKNKEDIVNSLSELSNLLEEQTSFDIKKIIVEI